MPVPSVSRVNFHQLCDQLADPDISSIIANYGYPPLWSRPNTFETLVHIILEQQVSLASALSALNKLKERIGEITPARVLLLTDDELKACYFSRQKTSYVKYLAEALVSGQLKLKELETLPDHEVRAKLTVLKGIGNWTADIYLMFVLHHADIFPIGDLAAREELKFVKGLPASTPQSEVATIAEVWSPCRTIATMLLWHNYLSRRAKK